MTAKTEARKDEITKRLAELRDAAQIQTEVERERRDKHYEVLGKINREQTALQNELVELDSPFKVGDIVIDEELVSYLVTSIKDNYTQKPGGIRLTKGGFEAHQNPRPIYSTKLVVKGQEGAQA